MCSTGLNIEVHGRMIEDMVGDVMVFRTCNDYILCRVEEVME